MGFTNDLKTRLCQVFLSFIIKCNELFITWSGNLIFYIIVSNRFFIVNYDTKHTEICLLLLRKIHGHVDNGIDVKFYYTEGTIKNITQNIRCLWHHLLYKLGDCTEGQ